MYVSILDLHDTNRICTDVLQILTISMTARYALITGDLSNAEELLTQEISADTNNYISYANRSIVMSRKNDWDHALDDAIKVR
jgi:hypothetical protein